MSGPVRRAGRGTDSTGALVVWSVAEGRRGRRWREVRSQAGSGVVSSLLLETEPDGRFSHAELSTSAGLLTLHPETDGTIHGNVVAATGVEAVAGLPWPADAILLVEGSTIAAAATVHGLRDAIRPGGSGPRPGVFVGLNLAVEAGAALLIERGSEETWRVRAVEEIAVDAEGLPVLAAGMVWPLDEG